MKKKCTTFSCLYIAHFAIGYVTIIIYFIDFQNSRRAGDQKLNILLEWPNTDCMLPQILCSYIPKSLSCQLASRTRVSYDGKQYIMPGCLQSLDWTSGLTLKNLFFFMLSNRAHKPCSFVSSYIHCEKGKIVLTQYVYLSVLLTVCIVKHSGVTLPAYSTQIKNLICIINKCHGKILWK